MKVKIAETAYTGTAAVTSVCRWFFQVSKLRLMMLPSVKRFVHALAIGSDAESFTPRCAAPTSSVEAAASSARCPS